MNVEAVAPETPAKAPTPPKVKATWVRVMSLVGAPRIVPCGPGAVEQVIGEECRDFRPTASPQRARDRVVIDNDRIVAVIRRGPDGGPEITRFG